MAQWLANLARNHEVSGSIPGLAQWDKRSSIAVSCGVGCRRGSDPALLWLWHRPAATAPITSLAWEPPYTEGEAQEMAKKKKKKNLSPLEAPIVAQWKSPTRNHEVAGSIPGLDHWVKDPALP